MEMKASEYRIGNIVNVLGSEDVIIGISTRLRPDCGYFEFKDFCKQPLKGIHIKPIPLTEGRLIDFGFKKDRYSFTKKISKSRGYRVRITIDFNVTPKSKKVYTTVWFKTYYDNNINKDIENCVIIQSECVNVHQLQNLYHALTGQELTTT